MINDQVNILTNQLGRYRRIVITHIMPHVFVCECEPIIYSYGKYQLVTYLHRIHFSMNTINIKAQLYTYTGRRHFIRFVTTKNNRNEPTRRLGRERQLQYNVLCQLDFSSETGSQVALLQQIHLENNLNFMFFAYIIVIRHLQNLQSIVSSHHLIELIYVQK